MSLNIGVAIGYVERTEDYLIDLTDVCVIYKGDIDAFFYLPSIRRCGVGRLYIIKNDSKSLLGIFGGHARIDGMLGTEIPPRASVSLIATDSGWKNI